MKIAEQESTVERAYELLDATPEERERLVTYATPRSNHDYRRDLQEARGGGYQ